MNLKAEYNFWYEKWKKNPKALSEITTSLLSSTLLIISFGVCFLSILGTGVTIKLVEEQSAVIKKSAEYMRNFEELIERAETLEAMQNENQQLGNQMN